MLALVTTFALAAAPEVALLDSAGDSTRLRFQPVGAAALAPVAASFTHGDGSTVLGALLPGRRVVLATAIVGRPRDESFGAALFRLEAGVPARQLVDRVAVSTRPVVLESGRVFVQRGRPGAPSAERERVDLLTVDEVDADTGQARTVYEARGFTTFLAGAAGGELIVYEVTPAGARLLAVHVDSLGVRTLTALPPLAFDFSVDAPRRRVVFTLGQPGVGAWRVAAVDLASGALTTLASGPSVALVPAVLPDGRVAWAPGEGEGLRVAGDGARLFAAQGPGFERVRAVVRGVAVGLHEVPSGFPRLFSVRIDDGRAVDTAFPLGARLDVAGVTP